MNVPLLTVSAILCCAYEATALPQDPSEYANWEARMLEAVGLQSKNAPDLAIPKLGEWLVHLSLPAHQEKNGRPVFHSAQQALLAFPAHADYFGDEIKKITEKQIENPNYSADRYPLFEALSHLPSPQSVRVLGELVFDERDPWRQPGWGDGGRPYANSFHAVRAFHSIGIKKPPVVRDHPDVYNDVRTWQLWFEQVRAGTRTFSFEGDDRIFSLAGPVSEAREPSSADPESITETSPAILPPESSKWPLVIAVILSLASLLLAAWRALKPRRS